MSTRISIPVAVAMTFSASTAYAADATFNGNPASNSPSTAVTQSTRVPGATGVNPYSGRSVGVPLKPNDLGSGDQEAKERNLCQTQRCERQGY